MKIVSYLLYKEIWFDFFFNVNVCTQRKEVSSAKCAGRRSNVPQPCLHTCWSTQTLGHTPASTVARGFIKNPTWRNIPISTQVSKARERDRNQSWTALMFRSCFVSQEHVSKSNISTDKSRKEAKQMYGSFAYLIVLLCSGLCESFLFRGRLYCFQWTRGNLDCTQIFLWCWL